MPQTIDVTGLTPEQVKTLESMAELFRQKPVSIAPPPAEAVLPRDLPPDEWVKWFRAWCASRPRLDVIADDSRESIYREREEL